MLDQAARARVALYKMFSTIWNSIDINRQPNFEIEKAAPTVI